VLKVWGKVSTLRDSCMDLRYEKNVIPSLTKIIFEK